MRIACCVSDESVLKQISLVFHHNAVDYERFSSASLLLRAVRNGSFDMIFVYLANTGGTRESIYSWLNCRSDLNLPVVLMSAVRNPEWIAAALDAGADDFIIYPFHPLEFMSRLNAAIRRLKKPEKNSIELMGFSLDRLAGKVTDHGKPIELTHREFAMAWLFFSSPGIFISRDVLSAAIWGVDREIANRTIEQHIYKLRKKLSLGIDRGIIIRTAYTQGYRLEIILNESAQSNPASYGILSGI